MARKSPSSEQALYEIIRKWLAHEEGGAELLERFEHAPEKEASHLCQFLSQRAASLPTEFKTYISGGHIDKLVNIAQAGSIHFYASKKEPELTPDKHLAQEYRYLEFVAERSLQLHTYGVDDVTPPLDAVFVMLEAVETPNRDIKRDVVPGDKRKTEMRGRVEKEEEPVPTSRPVPLSKTLQEHTHLVIIGEPGSGKTTTLQFIALCFATHGWTKEKLHLDESRIPIIVSLENYDEKKGMGPFLTHWLREVADIHEEVAQEWLDKGRLIILLDGLDEVSVNRRKAIIKAIEDFIATDIGRRSRMVVTSRIAGYRSIPGLGIKLAHYTILPFASVDDACPYVSGWLRALKSDGSEKADEEAKVLLEQVEQESGLHRVIGNPLLLRLLVAVYVKKGGELPTKPAELYGRYVEKVAWDRVRIRGEPEWDYLQALNALKIVAWTLASEGEARELPLAGKIAEMVPNLAEGRKMLTFLREQLGLLTTHGDDRGDLISFSHLSFQEYFVALYLKEWWEHNQEKCWTFLRPRLHLPSWREPILLLSGSLDNEAVDVLVNNVLKNHSYFERVLHRDKFLAAAIIGEGASVSPKTSRKVAKPLLRLYSDDRTWWVPFYSIFLWFLLTLFLSPIVPWKYLIFGTISWFCWCWVRPERFLFPPSQFFYIFPHRLFIRCIESIRNKLIDSLTKVPEPHRKQVVKETIKSFYRKHWILWGSLGRREEAIKILWRIGDHNAVKLLIRFCSLEDDGIPSIMRFLCRKTKRLNWYLEGAKVVHNECIDRLEDFIENTSNPKAANQFVQAIEHLNDKHDIMMAIRFLWIVCCGGHGNDEVIKVLRSITEGNDGDLAAEAMKSLAILGDEDGLNYLFELLESGDPNIRKYAVIVLSLNGGIEAIEALIEKLQNDPDYEVREEIVKSLGYLRHPRAVRPLYLTLLYQTLNDERGKTNISTEVIRALSQIGNRDAITFLLKLLWHEDEGIRCEAAKVLGNSRSEVIVGELIKKLQFDSSQKVRSEAAKSLDKIRDNEAVGPLIEALKQKNTVGRTTIEALGLIGDRRAVEHLIKIFRWWISRRKADYFNASFAAEALGRIGDVRAIEPLSKALSDGYLTFKKWLRVSGGAQSFYDFALKGVCALGRIRDDRVIEPLITALEHKNPELCAEAARALGQVGNIKAIDPLKKALHRWSRYPLNYIILAGEEEFAFFQAILSLVKIAEQTDDYHIVLRISSTVLRSLTKYWARNYYPYPEVLERMIARRTEIEVQYFDQKYPQPKIPIDRVP